MDSLYQNHKMWEGMGAWGFEPNDLDVELLHEANKQRIKRRHLPDVGKDPVAILDAFGLLTPEKEMRNAAMVLFGKNDVIASKMPRCAIDLVRYEGETRDEIAVQKRAVGNYSTLLGEAELFLHGELADAYGDPYPSRPPQLQMTAANSALMNALIHRDYDDPDGFARVSIFEDRIEITNSGGLLGKVDVAKAIVEKKEPVFLRNVLLAQAAYLADEACLRFVGTYLIKTIYEDSNFDVQFRNENDEFSVVFTANGKPFKRVDRT